MAQYPAASPKQTSNEIQKYVTIHKKQHGGYREQKKEDDEVILNSEGYRYVNKKMC